MKFIDKYLTKLALGYKRFLGMKPTDRISIYLNTFYFLYLTTSLIFSIYSKEYNVAGWIVCVMMWFGIFLVEVRSRNKERRFMLENSLKTMQEVMDNTAQALGFDIERKETIDEKGNKHIDLNLKPKPFKQQPDGSIPSPFLGNF